MTFQRGSWELWFWRDLRGTEVDFLVHKGGKFRLLEAKVSEHPGPDDAAGIDKVAAALGEGRVERAQVLCRTAAPYAFKSRGGLRVQAARVETWKDGA